MQSQPYREHVPCFPFVVRDSNDAYQAYIERRRKVQGVAAASGRDETRRDSRLVRSVIGVDWSEIWLGFFICWVLGAAMTQGLLLIAGPPVALVLSGSQLNAHRRARRALTKPYRVPRSNRVFTPGEPVRTNALYDLNHQWQGTYLGHRKDRAVVQWDGTEEATIGIDFNILEPSR